MNSDSVSSIFDQRSVSDIHDEIQQLYLEQRRPWVIGYSGGKDSTAALQLVWAAIEKLESEQRLYPIYVIASDTRVETPKIVDYITRNLGLMNRAAQERNMPVTATTVEPDLNGSFWVNLIGRGYPAPTTRFRWCTERMKIQPANRFIERAVEEYGEVIMVLGVRSAESATRAQLMSTYRIKGSSLLRRHTTLRGAYVYAPIQDFSVKDVWTYLLGVRSPWGNDNRDLSAMYRNANSGECPLVIDASTPSCGNSRFGCWVCTVATRDSSMEAMIDNGESWMQPLLEFRDWLFESTEPSKKRDFRGIKGRDGRVILKKDGTPAARTYKLEVNKDMLERLLRIEAKVLRDGPDPDLQLISLAELHEIRRIWRTERQDWEDSVPRIYQRATGKDISWPKDDDGSFDEDQRLILDGLCREYDVPFELLAKLLEAERQTDGMARRADIHKRIRSLLNEEWRHEDQIVEEARELFADGTRRSLTA
jgi:DNA sulfur modification protein DndC